MAGRGKATAMVEKISPAASSFLGDDEPDEGEGQEAASEAADDIEIAETPEGEEPTGEEAPPDEAAVAEAAKHVAELPNPEAAPKKGTAPSWKQFRDAERAAREHKALLDQQAQELADLRSWRQQQEQERQQAVERERQAQAGQGVPGVDRPYTQAELVQLRETDILEYNRVIGEMNQQQLAAQQQQFAAMQEAAVIRGHIDEFTRGNPLRNLPPRPDYPQAMEFLEQKVGAILKATGVPEGELPQRLNALSKVLIIDPALRGGMSVAQCAYEIATTLGWAAPTAQAAAPAQAAANGNGQRPPAVKSPQEKVRESRAKTAAANGSVGTIPGANAPNNKWPTLEEFKNADEETMDKWDREMPGWDENLQP